MNIILKLLVLTAVVAVVHGASQEYLLDIPIGATRLTYLDGVWDLYSPSAGQNLKASVPGDLITDMFNNDMFLDPLYNTTWTTESHWWNDHDWVYQTTFNYTFAPNAQEVLLVFDGVKMGANISVNGVNVGEALDEFTRYVFEVKNYLVNGENKITVIFDAGQPVDRVENRFMGCSGGWDWAPYSESKTFSKGIYKSVYTATVSELGVITNVVPQVFYNGEYPTAALTDSNNGPWTVELSVHMWAATATNEATITIETDFAPAQTFPVSLPGPGTYIINATLDASNVKLWWPNGYGAQNLYDVNITYTDALHDQITVNRRIGFRAFAMVTADDSNPAALKGVEGSGNLTMRFKVNGVDVFARGANFIPMEELEGRANAEAIRYLVRNAKDGNLNTLRVWGGGLFMYEEFYNACDEYGIMVYHDMMYTEGFVPEATPMQAEELRGQIRRLSQHTCIVIWNACNECGTGGLYDSFVMTIVAEEDKSRVIWPSSPSNGWISGVDRLWGLPSGKPVVSVPVPAFTTPIIEHHGYYFHGNGWSTIQNNSELVLLGLNLPEVLATPVPTGKYQPSFFTSEFGSSGTSSFESMSAFLSADNWGLHSPAMYQRNYACDNFIYQYFGNTQNLDLIGQTAFQRQMYQCMIGQALNVKGYLENRRSMNTFGLFIWQLNEIWPTGGWGIVEYGTPGTGQSIGGRWKPIMHFLQDTCYTDIFVACGADAYCILKNDAPYPFSATIKAYLVSFSTGKQTEVSTTTVTLDAGAGISHWWCLNPSSTGACNNYSTILSSFGCEPTGIDCYLLTEVLDSNGQIATYNEQLLNGPSSLKLQDPNIQILSVTGPSAEGYANIVVTAEAVGVLTVFTTRHDGRFSDNAMMLPVGQSSIQFIPYGTLDLDLLAQSLRVEHAQMYLPGGSSYNN
eukprot:TRINITY_DN4630_c0_g1_i1.p1 TRINITY_DN4630_c0_g1~~TRINITY_DN4630_c0_g1_i1.p1  ORF type:complete len:919 (-),score=251.71 TRINITY_DN4630_c0_g1_i1:36-2771(-)